MAIGDNIKKYRIKNNMSQEQLANKLYVSRQTISQWEKGQTQPTVDNIIRLKEIFCITADELIDKTDKEKFDFATEKYKFQFSENDFSQIKRIFFFKQMKFHIILLSLCFISFFLSFFDDASERFSEFWIGMFLFALFCFAFSLRKFSTSMKTMKQNICTTIYEYELTEYTIKINSKNSDKSEKTYNLNYDDIKNYESNNEYYFLYTDDNCFIINRNVLKDNSFINLHYFKQKSKYVEINSKDKVISNLFLIITILSLFIGLILTAEYSTEMLNRSWILFLFTPISISDLLYGIRLKKKNFKHKKNIISGIIITIMLCIYGSFCFIF